MESTVGFDPLRNISIYESRSLIIVAGLCSQSHRYHLLEIKRSLGSSDESHEMVSHPESYSEVEMNSIIATAKCVSIISNAFCIFGFIQLVESCYIVVVTKAQAVANLHGHHLFTVTETNLLPITYKVRNTMDESRYKSILQNMTLANNDFYFSYDYDLTKSMQQQAASTVNLEKCCLENLETKFVWNYYALKCFTGYVTGDRAESNTIENSSYDTATRLDRWIVPVIHGFLRQKTIRLETGDTLKYTLIARRSRLFAGTRYLRRGVDSDGFTANEVETEQIVTRKSDGDRTGYRSSSLCQIRGSIPLYWHHTNLFVPSPDIKVNELDYGYDAALLHFNMLKQSFGDNITVLNLVRTQNSTREVVVGQAFADLIYSLNKYYRRTEDSDSVSTVGEITAAEEQCTASQIKVGSDIAVDNVGADSKVEYIAFDFHGTPHSTLFSQLDQLCEDIFPRSGFFLLAKRGDIVEGEKDGEKNGLSPYMSWCSYVESHRNAESKEDSSGIGTGTGTGKQDEKCNSLRLPYSLRGETEDISNQISYDDLGGGIGSGFPVGVLQTGVLRTNCVDCLDRTNVAQFCYARHSLFHQLRALGADFSSVYMSKLEDLCSKMWSEHGDVLAHQYGGSGAMHSLTTSASSRGVSQMAQSVSSTSLFPTTPTTSTTRSSDQPVQSSPWDLLTGWGKSPAPQETEREFALSGGAKNALVAVQRYYSNISTDFERQQSIDLLLGVYVPQRGSIPIWDTDMYLPTVSRGKNACADTPSSVSAALSKDSQIDDYVDRQTVKREGGEAPLDNKSFSKVGALKSLNQSRQLVFRFRDMDYCLERSDDSLGNVSTGAHDVIAIDNIQCRPYPPDGRKGRTHLKEADSSSCVYDKVHLSESLQGMDQQETEVSTSHLAHTEAPPPSVGMDNLLVEEQGLGQLIHEPTHVPSPSSTPPFEDGDKSNAIPADVLYESSDSMLHIPSSVEAEVNACAVDGSDMRDRSDSTQDDDSNHDDIEFVKTSLQDFKVEGDSEKEIEKEAEGRDEALCGEAKDSMFSFPRYGSQPAHTMLEENASDEDYNASTTGTLDLPPPDRGFFSWFFPPSNA